ncbi:helicase HerA-like domain-containing protein, partial [Acinetobacter baumannii]
TPAERQAVMAQSPLRGKYDQTIDRESAYEMLAKRKALPEDTAQGTAESGGLGGILGQIGNVLAGGAATPAGKGRKSMSMTEMVV